MVHRKKRRQIRKMTTASTPSGKKTVTGVQVITTSQVGDYGHVLCAFYLIMCLCWQRFCMHLYLNCIGNKNSTQSLFRDISRCSIMKCLTLYILSVSLLRLSPLTEDTSMISVSSCGVKLQEVLSGSEKKAKTLDMHVHFCGFLNIHSFIFFLSSWGVTIIILPAGKDVQVA